MSAAHQEKGLPGMGQAFLLMNLGNYELCFINDVSTSSYFSALFLMAAWAAAILAIGTRYGEQDT